MPNLNSRHANWSMRNAENNLRNVLPYQRELIDRFRWHSIELRSNYRSIMVSRWKLHAGWNNFELLIQKNTFRCVKYKIIESPCDRIGVNFEMRFTFRKLYKRGFSGFHELQSIFCSDCPSCSTTLGFRENAVHSYKTLCNTKCSCYIEGRPK